jgi:hypothetical protein
VLVGRGESAAHVPLLLARAAGEADAVALCSALSGVPPSFAGLPVLLVGPAPAPGDEARLVTRAAADREPLVAELELAAHVEAWLAGLQASWRRAR